MAAKSTRSELQRRLEGSITQQDVVSVGFTLKKVDCTPLEKDEDAVPAVEAILRRSIASCAGVDPVYVHIAFTPKPGDREPPPPAPPAVPQYDAAAGHGHQDGHGAGYDQTGAYHQGDGQHYDQGYVGADGQYYNADGTVWTGAEGGWHAGGDGAYYAGDGAHGYEGWQGDGQAGYAEGWAGDGGAYAGAEGHYDYDQANAHAGQHQFVPDATQMSAPPDDAFDAPADGAPHMDIACEARRVQRQLLREEQHMTQMPSAHYQAAAAGAPAWVPNGTITVECIVTPMGDGSGAAGVLNALKARVAKDHVAKFTELISNGLMSTHATKLLIPAGLEVDEFVVPEILKAMWPELPLGKHSIPARLFSMLDSVQAFNDARVIRKSDGSLHPTGCQKARADELMWGLSKICEIYKDAKLEKLFALVVTGILKRSRLSCVQWASIIPGTQLRNVLFDNPVKEEIFAKTTSAGTQTTMLQKYISTANTCVAMAAVAADITRHWTEDMAPPDKAWLSEVAGGFSDWTDLSVPLARNLWGRTTSRYIVLDGMAKSNGGADNAIRHLRRVPGDILTSTFKAPWRGTGKDCSFFYMFEGLAKLPSPRPREDFMDVLIEAYLQPEVELEPVLKSYIEDWDLPSSSKQDFLIAFVSECRIQETKPPEKEERKRCTLWFTGTAKGPSDSPTRRQVPDLTGLVNLILTAVASAWSARLAANPTGAGNHTDLAEVLDIALLLATGESIVQWAKAKKAEDTRGTEEFRRFLRGVVVHHIVSMCKAAEAAKKLDVYNEDAASALLDHSEVWKHDGQNGVYSECSKPAKRKAQDYTQLLLSYFTLEFAMEGSGLWDFVQAMEEGNNNAMATRFGKFAPEGSSLRIAMAKEARRALGDKGLDVGKLAMLMGYYGFFSPTFYAVLQSPDCIRQLRESVGNKGMIGRVDIVFQTLRTILLVVSQNRGWADSPLVDTLVGLRKNMEIGGSVGWQLFSHVLEAVQQRDLAGLSLVILCDTAKELGKSGQLLVRKMEKNVRGSPFLLQGTTRAVAAALARSKPDGWASSLKSLDQVIFTLEYMGKEDFEMAQARFKWEVRNATHKRRELWELLAAVFGVYKSPLTGTDTAGFDADMNVREIMKKHAPKLSGPVYWRGASFTSADWGILLEITAAAAECMQKRFNVVMIPHHVQLMTVLMFGFRTCAIKGGGEGVQTMPKTMLARVGTGEGKSLIIAMLAAFVAKKGLRAHVINDNRVLTRRDFDTNNGLFQALGIVASPEPEHLKDPKYQIVYCGGDDVEKACLECLTEGTSKKYEEDLRNCVLIVDEVDGMIFDKGPASLKEFADAEFSNWVNEWLEQLEEQGRIMKDENDFRAYGDSQSIIQRELEEAFHIHTKKKEGVDYATRGTAMYLLDEKTHMIREDGSALWLEVLKYMKNGTRAQYKYIKAVLCRLQCFMSYSAIFGLTGSLGQQAEKDYLLQYYDAVTFNVPFFLDTCRSDEEMGKCNIGDIVTIKTEDGDKAGATKRRGTRGNLGKLMERRAADKLCRVDLGDNKEAWYKETAIEKCISAKKAPKDIGQQTPFAGLQAQEEAVVKMAAAKCTEVPVLVLAKNTDAVHRMSQALRTMLGPCWGDGTGGVLELLHNPRNPKEFVDLVDLSTEPLKLDEAHNAYRISVTTAEGGRGHDYRVVDPGIDDRGGLLLLLTWVPWSEREWIQFIGRTGRQDHAGQYAVFLDSDDEKVKSVATVKRANETLPQAILRQGNDQTAELLKGVGDDISKARLMHKLSSFYWTAHMKQETDKQQDWAWKGLCEGYTAHALESILNKFKTEVLEGADISEEDLRPQPIVPSKTEPGKYAPTKASPLKSMAELTCQRCGHVNFVNWSPDQPLPKVACEKCEAATIMSSFVPVYASTL